jgi:dethiobiotin synthetase
MSSGKSHPGSKPATRIVVLGTGTGIGKTWVTQTLTEALQRAGAQATALKPIETGIPSPSTPAISDPRSTIRSADAGALGERSDASLLASISTTRPAPPPYALPDPVSPHLAARRAGRVIELRQVRDYVVRVENEVTSHVTSFVLVESAGGCLSPLGLGVSNADLALALEPAIWILVAPDALGVLHDVSATLGVLAARRRLPDHVVLSAAREPDASTGTNAAELEALGIVTPSVTAGRGDTHAFDAFARDLVARAARGRGAKP